LVLKTGGELSIDSRPVRDNFEGEATDYVSPPGSGVKLDLRGEVAGGLRRSKYPAGTPAGTPDQLNWAKYGATVGGFIDVYAQRVLGLSVIVDFADPFRKDGIIPFTELVSLGGARPLRGFVENRLLDRSSAVALLEYTWP